MPVIQHNHGAGTAFKEVPDGSVAKVPRIFTVKRDGGSSPQFIADVLVYNSSVYAQRLKCVHYKILQYPAKLDFGKPRPPGFIFLDRLIIAQFLVVEFLGNAFGKDRNTVVYAIGQPFYYRACKHIGNLFEGQLFLSELLRNERYCCPCSLPDAECEMAGMPAHRGDEIPPASGLCVFHYILDNLHSQMPRRLIAKRW